MSIISAGFSSWIYVNVNSSTINDINVNVGNVTYNELFTMGNNDLTMFFLGPDGLVEDETIVSSSKIVAKFHIINSVAYNISNNGVFNFESILECSNQEFINTYIEAPTLDVLPVSNTSNKVNNKIINDIKINVGSSGTTKIELTYNVNDTSNNIKSYYSNKPTFNFKLRGK
ncbi:MAG: hypothetical protein MR606_05150 [Mollicutes bacterium]|nr:hypothetical protein [Mollicutes bacterium]MDD7263694.1 hypothetical protein [bacterium]MDY4979459.1 hypothetical protein [Candidatus Onthovivens sp.]